MCLSSRCQMPELLVSNRLFPPLKHAAFSPDSFAAFPLVKQRLRRKNLINLHELVHELAQTEQTVAA